MAAGQPLAASDISTGTVRKVRNHLIPLLFLLYIVAFLDRVNIGFAALTMKCGTGNHECAIRARRRDFLLGLLLI
jgi:ACS family tartrate transporter-like MFS transporter